MSEKECVRYGNFAERFKEKSSLFFLPVDLYIHPYFSKLSCEAVTLYGILRCIQEIGDETDFEGKKCISFTINEVTEVFHCGIDKAKRIVHELDTKNGAGLIVTRKLSDGHTITYIRDPFEEKGPEGTGKNHDQLYCS